jgi:N-acetylmuramoyl-L-alanine amidase
MRVFWDCVQKPNHRDHILVHDRESYLPWALTMENNHTSAAVLLFGLLLLLIGCNRSPYAATNKQYKKTAKTLARELRGSPAKQTVATAPSWVGTTNFNMRKPNIVVIHHTAQNSCDQTLKTFTLPRTSVSAHYVICKDGTVHHMLNDYLRAWHGGVAKWGNITDLNSASIGIEIDNNGFEPFTDLQVSNLLVVLDSLKSKYGIPTANFIGHADIAPTRKNDPNVQFPWETLANRGFGLWWGDTTGVTVPPHFNTLQALRIIGYDVKDSSAAINAFSRKYLKQEGVKQLDAGGQKVLYSLYGKFL